jgi:hypothetical protein
MKQNDFAVVMDPKVWHSRTWIQKTLSKFDPGKMGDIFPSLFTAENMSPYTGALPELG